MNEALLSAPIPGQSLTTELGNNAWEQPPRIVDLDETVRYYVDRIMSPPSMVAASKVISEGFPILQLAEVMIQNSVMKGEHSIDIGMIVMPVVVELLISVAEISGVEYTLDADSEASRQQMLGEDDYRSIISKVKPKVVEKDTKVSRGLMSKEMV